MRQIGLRIATLALLTACEGAGTGSEPPAFTPPPDDSSDAAAPPVASWAPVVEGTPRGWLLGVWGRAADDIYVVGGVDDRPAIGHWNGVGLRWFEAPGDARAWWVHGTEDRTWVVGEDGLGLVRDADGPWTRWETGVEGVTLYGVWGAAHNDVWIVGGDVLGVAGTVLRHWDGEAWTDAALPDMGPNPPKTFFKVWGAAGDDVFVAGDRGAMLHYDGTVWRRLDAPEADAIFTVHGRGDSVWAVGGRGAGLVWRFEGGTWRREGPRDGGEPVLLPGLTGVFLGPDGDLLVSGNRGTLLERGTDGEWSSLPSGTRDVLHAVWIAPNGERWAVGGNLLNPVDGETGIVLRGPPAEPISASPPDPIGAADAGPSNDGGPVDPPLVRPDCGEGWIAGRGPHRLFLEGREGDPDARGRYPMLEDIHAVRHGEHYLLGVGAFAEWSAWLCGDISDDILFMIPNNDDPGSEVLHQLFLVRDGEEHLIAEATDTQAGESGYNPYIERPVAIDVESRAGDELLLRTTNLVDVMYSVMIFRPPSEYMSYIELVIVDDGEPGGRPDDVVDAPPCTASLTVGGDGDEFEPLGDPAVVPLLIGPQGSFMLPLSLRVEAPMGGNPDDPLGTDNPLVEMAAHLGGLEIGQLRQRVSFVPTDAGSVATGLLLTIDPDVVAADLVGIRVDLSISVTAPDRVRACGDTELVPMPR